MKIIKAKDYVDVSKKSAEIIAAQVTLKPDSVLGLATGSTPEGLYANLVKSYKNGNIDFANVKTVNLDEYKGLPRENNQSYFYFMNHHLFEHINIDKNNTNVPDGTVDSDTACKNYEQVIENMGGIDMQLLGIGNNGHIGFNEPCDHFPKVTHCVKLSQSTIAANTRFFEKEEDVPREAYTMGIGSIMKAKTILLVASGKGKAQILFDTIHGKITPEIPASILQLHPNVIIVADEEALSLF